MVTHLCGTHMPVPWPWLAVSFASSREEAVSLLSLNRTISESNLRFPNCLPWNTKLIFLSFTGDGGPKFLWCSQYFIGLNYVFYHITSTRRMFQRHAMKVYGWVNVQSHAFLNLGPGHAVAHLVVALRYKPAGRGFDSRWCHWNFSST